MALGTIATVATIAAAAASIAAQAYAANAASNIQPSNAASTIRQVAGAQAHALPDQLKLQQLMQQGAKGTVTMPAHDEERLFIKVPKGATIDPDGVLQMSLVDSLQGTPGLGPLAFGKEHKVQYDYIPYDPKEWEGKDVPGEIVGRNVTIPEGPQEVDFTGYGTADIEGELAKRQADLEIALGKKYGTEFASTARQLQEQADPLGTKARALEDELINRDMPVSPISGKLNSAIDAQVKAGRALDSMSSELLDKAVAEAAASRGGGSSAGDVAQSMSTGAEGQARLNAALAKSQGFMSSGVTPEDIEFQRTQQQIANRGAFVNGQTPQSQFSAIARSGQGATPISGAQANATMPNNAGQVGSSYATNAYGLQTNAALSGSNNWFTGLSSLLSGIGSLKTGTG